MWFLLLIAAGALAFSVQAFIQRAVSGEPPLILAIWPLLMVVLAVVFRDIAVLKVEPECVVSRLRHRAVKRRLHPTDRLRIVDGHLFVVDLQGGWEEIPLNRPLLRASDWRAFEAAVIRRWPPPQP